MPITRGRGFTPADREGSERVVVINEALAAKYFPGEDPIGRVIRTGFGPDGERVVGVVGNAAEASLTDPPVPARYMLYEHVPPVFHEATFVVAASDPEQMASLVDRTRTTMQFEVRNLALQRVTTMASVLDQAVGAPQRVATLLSLLAALALVLGGVGVYGVINHFVSRRVRDYGICIALGLPPTRVLVQVVRRGVLLALAGGAIGVGATVLAARRLMPLLHDVSPTHMPALTGAVLALIAAAVISAFIPAWRASRTAPAVVLRQQ